MKCILILGAKSDIAMAVARLYALKKYYILLAGRSIESLINLSCDLAVRYQTEVCYFQFDASDFDPHHDFYKGHGHCPDVVLCAFGFLGDQLLAESNWEQCNTILTTNYCGAVSIPNHVANDMENRKSEVIVGISSVAEDRGRRSNYIYGSAKAGFSAYLSGLCNRLVKSNAHVVTVKPGFVFTRMIQGLKLPRLLSTSPQWVTIIIARAIEKEKILFMYCRYGVELWLSLRKSRKVFLSN